MYHLTTDHAASSHGIPVLVDDQGRAYGPLDLLPENISAASWASEHLPDDERLQAFVAPVTVRAASPGRPRLYPVGSMVQVTMDLPVDLLQQIDARRGQTPRNAAVAALLRQALST
jgi:hypothetical protein